MSYIQCCPACQSTMLEELLDLGDQPLSLVDMSRDMNKSESLPRYAISLYICRRCGHVHNIYFNPNFVNYSQEGCRMWNQGSGWKEHIESVKALCESFEDLDAIIEVGAGDCEFLASLRTDAVRIAVDPCEAVEQATERGVEVYHRDYFDPDKHMPEAATTLIVMRHLLEHMENPRIFLEPIVERAKRASGKTYLYVETPCINKAIKGSRIEDWTYEHPQHFTLTSMNALFNACGIKKSMVRAGYDGEVVMAVAEIEPDKPRGLTVDKVLDNYGKVSMGIVKEGDWISRNLDDIALWGGSGKSAMFINKFGFPPDTRVIDSDERKVGFCVPGTRIKMMDPVSLRKFPVKYIIATTSWRANDIRDEIRRLNLDCEKLLKFENGKLVEVPLG